MLYILSSCFASHLRRISPSGVSKVSRSLCRFVEIVSVTQGRSDGGSISVYIYRYIYPPPKKKKKTGLPYKFLCGYWLFFSLTQDKFYILPVCAFARVSFTYLHTTIYTPPKKMKFLATPLPSLSSFIQERKNTYFGVFLGTLKLIKLVSIVFEKKCLNPDKTYNRRRFCTFRHTQC